MLNLYKRVIQYKFGWFFLFFFLFISLDIGVELLNNRFSTYDLKVYLGAAKALRLNQQVYGVAFGLPTGFYKYSPFILLLFIPFTYLSEPVAGVLHVGLEGLCYIGLSLALRSIWVQLFPTLKSASTRSLGWFWLSVFMGVVICLVREFHLGNVNLIVLFLLCKALELGLQAEVKNGLFWSGCLIGLATLFKPFLLVLLFPFVFNQKVKILVGFSSAIFAGPLLVFTLMGFQNGFQLHLDWLKAMGAHSTYLQSNHTLSSLLFKTTGVQLPFSAYFFFIAGVIVYGSYKLLVKKMDNGQAIFTEYILILALLPNLLVTDTEHFIWSLPLIAMILGNWWYGTTGLLHQKFKWAFRTLLCLVLFMYGGNSSDLLGNKGSDWFENMGLLGWGNLGLIAFYLLLPEIKSPFKKQV